MYDAKRWMNITFYTVTYWNKAFLWAENDLKRTVYYYHFWFLVNVLVNFYYLFATLWVFLYFYLLNKWWMDLFVQILGVFLFFIFEQFLLLDQTTLSMMAGARTGTPVCPGTEAVWQITPNVSLRLIPGDYTVLPQPKILNFVCLKKRKLLLSFFVCFSTLTAWQQPELVQCWCFWNNADAAQMAQWAWHKLSGLVLNWEKKKLLSWNDQHDPHFFVLTFRTGPDTVVLNASEPSKEKEKQGFFRAIKKKKKKSQMVSCRFSYVNMCLTSCVSTCGTSSTACLPVLLHCLLQKYTCWLMWIIFCATCHIPGGRPWWKAPVIKNIFSLYLVQRVA